MTMDIRAASRYSGMMRRYAASVTLLLGQAFTVLPCTAQEFRTSVRLPDLPQHPPPPQVESGGAQSSRPLDLSIRRDMTSPQVPPAAMQSEDSRLGKAIAATAVRPCIAPLYREVYQVRTVPSSQDVTTVGDATGNTAFVATSAIWLTSQAVSGACRK